MVYAVVMAGGVGTRFWPLSTPRKPKQLVSLFGNKPMIKLTLDRITPLIDPEKQKIVTIPDQARDIQREIPDRDPDNFIIEPFARNTAACIGLSAIRLFVEDENAIMVVLPADHLIQNDEEFRDALKNAIECVEEMDALITLGIEPSRPETGYGYIQYERDEIKRGLHRVKTFAEKPNEETARRFIETGEFLWNSGIFVWSARRILSEIEEHLPILYVALMEIKEALGKPDETLRIHRAYQSIKPTSIDYGVMEHSRHVYTIRGEFDWSDVGNWEELYRLTNKDEQMNAIQGDVVTYNTKNSYLNSANNKPLAVVGLDNVIVVSTESGTLVCNRSDVQNVRFAAEQINRQNK